MDFLKMLLMIGDPLFLAFISSVIIGITLKRASSILFIKRLVSLIVFGVSFLLYFYLVYIVKGTVMYIAMFAPLAIALIFVIVAVIAAPRDEIKEESKKEYKMTGWDTMFPNDIDNDR